MINYSQGLNEAINVIYVMAILMVLFSLIVTYSGKKHVSGKKLVLLAVVSILITPFCLSILLFSFIYSTSNLFFQDISQIGFWKEELASGVFAIRVSSYVLTVQFFISFFRLIRSNRKFTKTREKQGLGIDDSADHTIQLGAQQKILLIKSDSNFISIFQFLFYLACVSTLWLCVLYEAQGILIAICSWCLFFIIDDWAIVSDYTNEYSVPLMTNHYYKIMLFNAALLITISIAAFIWVNLLIASLLVAVLFFCALSIYMYSWRARKHGSEVSEVNAQQGHV